MRKSTLQNTPKLLEILRLKYWKTFFLLFAYTDWQICETLELQQLCNPPLQVPGITSMEIAPFVQNPLLKVLKLKIYKEKSG